MPSSCPNSYFVLPSNKPTVVDSLFASFLQGVIHGKPSVTVNKRVSEGNLLFQLSWEWCNGWHVLWCSTRAVCFSVKGQSRLVIVWDGALLVDDKCQGWGNQIAGPPPLNHTHSTVMSAKPTPEQQKTICGLEQTTKLVEKGENPDQETRTEGSGTILSTYL